MPFFRNRPPLPPQNTPTLRYLYPHAHTFYPHAHTSDHHSSIGRCTACPIHPTTHAKPYHNPESTNTNRTRSHTPKSQSKETTTCTQKTLTRKANWSNEKQIRETNVDILLFFSLSCSRNIVTTHKRLGGR